jgi:carbonic anhydrase
MSELPRPFRSLVVIPVLALAAVAALSISATVQAKPAPPCQGDACHPKGCICETGERQSPIDIGKASSAKLRPISFLYSQLVEGELYDTGETIRVEFTGHPRPSFVIGGDSYEIEQLHFHAPSEHLQNGNGWPMELHFVHSDRAGNAAAVGVFLSDAHSRANPTIADLWRQVPARPGERKKIKIRLSTLLPADRRYVQYAGSLTTSPCAEGVRWYMLLGQLDVSSKQVSDYRYPHSARAIQPLNGRPVLKSP